MVDCVSLTCITPSRAIRMVYLTLIQETATPLKAPLVILFRGNLPVMLQSLPATGLLNTSLKMTVIISVMYLALVGSDNHNSLTCKVLAHPVLLL